MFFILNFHMNLYSSQTFPMLLFNVSAFVHVRGDSLKVLDGYWVSRGSSENLHSHSCDTDKKQKHSRCLESSLCSASLCLSVCAACEKIVEMKQKTGGGRNPESLIRWIWVKKLRKARTNQKNTSINSICYSLNEVVGINVFKNDKQLCEEGLKV